MLAGKEVIDRPPDERADYEQDYDQCSQGQCADAAPVCLLILHHSKGSENHAARAESHGTLAARACTSQCR
jgi:hypothetical protein